MVLSLEAALEQVSRARLAVLPTPLEPLSNWERELGHPGIYIKRDDMTGLGPGGNKLRSLEFLAGEALEQGADTLIAAGPLQSNLCTLAAAASAKLGLRCILVHNGEKPERLEGNVLLNQLLGAECRYLGPVDAGVREQVVAELCRELAVSCHPYVIRNGATTGRGALGYVQAVPELERQFRERGIRQATLFAPGGNGGVATGLIYGNALLGFPFQVVIISVEDDRETLLAHIRQTLQEAEEILGLPFPGSLEEACVVDDTFRGEGWSVNTPASSRMVGAFARREGILVENVYNSKVLVGMEAYIRDGRVPGAACYLHTGGFGSLFAQY